MTTISEEKGKRFEISAATLKNIAIILMAINHFGTIIFEYCMDYYGFWDRFQWHATRGSFVIFAFQIAEGMCKTHDRRKYIHRLGLLAIISEIPYDLCFYHTFFTPYVNNVFFTLCFGAIGIAAIDSLAGKRFKQIACGLFFVVLAYIVASDYDAAGVLLIYCFYFLRDRKKLMFIVAGVLVFAMMYICYFTFIWANGWDFSLLLDSALEEAHGILVFPLLALYKGKKGKMLPRWFYYFFYPAHLLLLYAICMLWP